MKALKEIASISGFKPTGGDLLEAFNLMNDDLCRTAALAHWQEDGKSKDHFRRTYKNLKDQLLDGIFRNSFNDYSAIKRYRIQCWKKFSQAKILLIADKRIAAVKVAGETIRLARQCGFTEIVLLLAQDLEYYFGAIRPDTARYRRYRKMVRETRVELDRETEIVSLFAAYNYQLTKKKDCSELLERIEQLRPVPSPYYKYNLFYYLIEVHRGIQHNDASVVLQACTEAIRLFKHQQTLLPYTIQWSFTRKMIPFLIAQGQYAQAEMRIMECLELPRKGSYNWNINLLQLADLGFKSDKPRIAYEAWKMARYTPGKIESPVIAEIWRIVQAYLVLYHNLGRLELPENFKLGKFLNSVPLCAQDKTGVNTAIIIVEMLHLLFSNRKKRYMERVETLNHYAHDHLQGKEHSRTRNFLKMLVKIEMADYFRIRTEAMTRRYWNMLRRTPPEININIFETEVIPYETLWGWILERLK